MHDLPISLNDIIVCPFHEDFIFINIIYICDFREYKTLAKKSQIYSIIIHFILKSGRLAQSVTCTCLTADACLTADSGVASLISAPHFCGD